MCSLFMGSTGVSGSAGVSAIGDETTGPTGQSESPFVYDLRLNEGSPESYFNELATFSDEVLDQIEKQAGAILDRYIEYNELILQEVPTSRGEAAMDLLTVGAVTSIYGASAGRVPAWVLRELQKLSWKRDRPALTTGMLRDALFAAFMKVDSGRRADVADRPPRFSMEVEQLPHLIEWLQCTIDLGESSRRLINWLSLLRTLTPSQASDWMARVQDLFDWFQTAAGEALGNYTRGVSRFLAARRPSENRRPDRFLRGKKAVEYHLAMVAAEIGNRGMRHAFRRCPRKLVIVPACMRGANARTSPGGQSAGLDVTCEGCDPSCNVNKATALLGLSEARVYLENCPRTSVRLAARWSQEPRTGVVIAACLAIMPSVQAATRSARMTCQFLPLDFPGCQSHWLRHRIPATSNESELVWLVTGSKLRRL